MAWRSICICVAVLLTVLPGFADEGVDAAKMSGDGNYREAYEKFRGLTLKPEIGDRDRAGYYTQAVFNMLKAELFSEFDAFTAEVIKKGGDEPLTAMAVAREFIDHQLPGYGQTVGGVFTRGPTRGRRVYCDERDRVQALQLLLEVKSKLGNLSNVQRAEYYLTLADVLLKDRGVGNSWKLQYTTDTERLPEYAAETMRTSAPPVNPDGSPVLYQVPKSFETAGSDGERWRWALLQAERSGDAFNAKMKLAQFLRSDFGLPYQNRFDGYYHGKGIEPPLKDDEYYAQLANGLQRFTLPDGLNPIMICRSLLYAGKAAPYTMLSDIFQARGNYVEAVKVLDRWLKEHGDAADKEITDRYRELTGYTGSFEAVRTYSAGRKPVLTFNYRNVPEVDLVLRPFAVDKFLAESGKMLANQMFLDDFYNFYSFRKLLTPEQKEQFMGATIEQWMVKLDPGTEHKPQKLELTLPVSKPGMYVLVAVIPGGNEIRELICISEYTLEVRELNDTVMCFVTEAAGGKPVRGRKIRIWGCRTDRSKKPVVRLIDEFEVKTDDKGMAIIPRNKFKDDYSYVIHVRDENDKSAYAITFRHTFWPHYNLWPNHNLRIFGISSQPVYKPGDTVSFQFWLRDLDQVPDKPKIIVEQEAEVAAVSYRGSEIWKKVLKTDSAGMLWGSFKLPDDVDLGEARIRVNFKGAGLPENLNETLAFRVEEYRKPEFEVEIQTPQKAVTSGEKIDVKISGQYYFGGAVRGAVSYRVTRSVAYRPWHKFLDYNWLYDKTHDYYSASVDTVMSGIGELGEDGTLLLAIDTAQGVTADPGLDYRYQISAEVTDITRRSVSAVKSVLAAAVPYQAEIDIDKGYYHAGDMATAKIMLFDTARQPAAGQAEVALCAIAYDSEHKATETRLRDWTGLKVDESGVLQHSFRLGNPGLYRIKVSVKAGNNYDAQNFYDIVVLGDKQEKVDYEFGELKVLADKDIYQPGDTAELLITAGVKDGTVLWFERTNEGKVPEIITLANGMAVRKITITEQDMPNIFVEAEMVHNGERVRTSRELRVPPRRKILNVEITPTQPHYEPGMEGTLKLRITDVDGKGVKGIFTVTVYDKALDAIASKSNVQDVRKLFWGRLRHFNYGNSYFNMSSIDRTGQQIAVKKAYESAPRMEADTAGRVETPEMDVRSDFRDSALWRCAVLTNDNGESTIQVPLPDDITAWHSRVWAVDEVNAVGQGEAGFIARKDIFTRLIMPRFLVIGDQARIMAVVHNSTEIQNIQAELSSPDGKLNLLNSKPWQLKTENGQAQAYWPVKAIESGRAKVLAKAMVGSRGDAVQMELPVLDYGLPQLWSRSGKIENTNTESVFVPLDFPQQVAPGSAAVEIKLTTSPASSVLELLPYLITNDRKDLYALTGRLHALIAAQRFVRFNIETGLIHKIPAEYAMIYDEAEANRLMLETLKRFTAYQNPDGGWGWFYGYYEVSSADTTAHAVSALAAARKAGFKIDEASMEQGLTWLKAFSLRDRDKMDPNTAAAVNYAFHAAGRADKVFSDFIYEQRARLSQYHLALLGLSTTGAQQQMVLRNLQQFLTENPANETARISVDARQVWRSGGAGELETNAAYLRLLLQTDPESPETAKVVKYLVENRFHSMQDTAVRENAACVEALNGYLAAVPPGKITAKVDIKLDGQLVDKVTLDSNIMLPPQNIKIGSDRLKERRHSLEFKRSGEGPVYFTANLSCYNQDKNIGEKGGDLQVKRLYWLLVPEGRDQFKRTPLNSGDKLKPGDLVETELILNTAYDFQYLMIEDRRPAGLEPVNPISGYSYSYAGTYIETRSTATRFYIKRSGIGSSTWNYRMRAETDGVFTALPATAVTLYTPGVQGNSTEHEFKVGSTP